MVVPKESRWSPLPAHRRTARSAQPRHRARGDDGISLVEVLVAFVVLMITVIPLTYVLNSALAGAADARQREAALQLADSWIEILSNSTPPTRADGTILTNTPQTPTAPSGAIVPKSSYAGTNFAVTANYSFQSVNQAGQSDLCTDEEPPSPTHPGVIQLQVTVTWDGGKHSLTDTTNINYPKPGLQTQGFLAVQVNNDGETDVHGNSAAIRLQAVPIQITGPSVNLTLYPDSNGCAFAQVPNGTYTVKVTQPTSGTPSGFTGYNGSPSFVDLNGNAPPLTFSPEQVQVTAETTVAVTFDEGINTSVSYGGAAAVAGGVECPASAGLTCLSLGNGPSHAAAAWGGNGSTWSSTTLAAASTLSQVGCTSGISSTCVGVGESSSGSSTTGVILTTTSDLGGVRSDTPPGGVTDITQVACPSSNGCYAIGTSGSGPVLLAGAVGQSPLPDTWVTIAPPSTSFTALSSIACLPTTTICMVGESASVGGSPSTPGILRLDGDPAGLAGNSGWTPTFTLESPPPNLSAVGILSCPSSSLCLATATGDSTSPSDPTVLAASVGATGPDSWADESTFPTGAGSVTGLSCGTSDCVAIGTAAGGGPAVWTGDLTTSTHDWAPVAIGANGIPSSVSAVNSVSCGSPSGGDTADCIVAAAAGSQSVPGVLLEGSLNGSWAWNPTTAPTSSPVLYYTGVACEAAGSGGTTCAAAGGTATGPVIVTTSHPNDSSWNVRTPSSLAGATVTGIPLETSPATLSAWTTQVTQAQAGSGDASSLPSVLYPLASGYSIVAGDCSSEVSPSATGSVLASPGGTASPTVPLGLLPLEVNFFGAPVSGATVTLTSTQCSPDTYTLPTTDAAGLTTSSVPYGTYTYSVNGSTVANTTITVGTSSVTVTTSPPTTPSTTTTYLPGPVGVLP